MFQSEAQKRWGTPVIMVKNKSRRKNHGRRLSSLHIILLTILLALMTSSSILAFEWLWSSFLSSSIFTLRGISIQGNRRVSSADILDAANLRVGTDSIYSIMSHITEKCIKSRSRYLKRVKVWRGLVRKENEGILGWVNIEVKEREPVALVSYGESADSFMLVDNQGFVLEEIQCSRYSMEEPGIRDQVGAYSSTSLLGRLPVIVGVKGLPPIVTVGGKGDSPIERALPGTQAKSSIDFAPGLTGDLGDSASLTLALDVLSNARSALPELFNEISYIDARNRDDILLVLDSARGMGDFPHFGYSMERLRAKSQTLKAQSSTPFALRSSPGVQYPGSDKVTVRLASDRIRDGMIDILPVVAERRDKRTEYIDARFPGAVYCIGD